jgi:hypothetical protein
MDCDKKFATVVAEISLLRKLWLRCGCQFPWCAVGLTAAGRWQYNISSASKEFYVAIHNYINLQIRIMFLDIHRPVFI